MDHIWFDVLKGNLTRELVGNIKLFLVMISEITRAEYYQNQAMGRWRERLNRKTGSAGKYLDCARLDLNPVTPKRKISSSSLRSYSSNRAPL